MDAIAAFLITLGVVGVINLQDKDGSDAETPAPAATQETTGVLPSLPDLRRRRIELTNAWLRSLRRVAGQSEVVPPTQIASPTNHDPPG